eukprot:m.484306 g.484306  ORF g.484306 m.484306 type:complete len:93 (+) comp23288_c0_seq1:135-413(+)
MALPTRAQLRHLLRTVQKFPVPELRQKIKTNIRDVAGMEREAEGSARVWTRQALDDDIATLEAMALLDTTTLDLLFPTTHRRQRSKHNTTSL